MDEIPADALTVCMRTTENTLSFWRVEEGQEDKAILALLGSLQRFDKVELVYIEDEALGAVRFEQNPGSTAFKDLADLHVDVCDLNQITLVSTAKALGELIYSEEVVRISRPNVKKLIQSEVNAGRLKLEDLSEHMREELLKAPGP